MKPLRFLCLSLHRMTAIDTESDEDLSSPASPITKKLLEPFGVGQVVKVARAAHLVPVSFIILLFQLTIAYCHSCGFEAMIRIQDLNS